MSAIFQPPKETDVAYLAGLMDGEGCMAIRQRKGDYKTLAMEIVGTDRTPLDWAQSRFGGTVRKLQEKRENRRQPWHWQVTRGEHLSAIALMIRPYLKVKWGEATLLIIIGHLRRMRKTPYGPTEHRKAEDHLARLSTLLKQPGKGGVAAYEEALDLAIYLKGALIEQEAREARMTPEGVVSRDLSHSGQRVTMAPPEPKNRIGKPTAPLTGAPRADAP